MRNYPSMGKHTTLDLDPQLIAEAGEILGTRGNGATVRAALSEVVRARRRAELLAMTSDLDLEDLDAMRRSRFEG